MDTSKEYIEMCGKAKEIQELSPLTEDCGFHYKDGDIHISQGDWYEQHLNKDADHKTGFLQSKKIWLPRQDQLQDILKEDYSNDEFPLFMMLNDFVEQENDLDQTEGDRSLEKGWLCFVMKDKFGKEWEVLECGDKSWAII